MADCVCTRRGPRAAQWTRALRGIRPSPLSCRAPAWFLTSAIPRFQSSGGASTAAPPTPHQPRWPRRSCSAGPTPHRNRHCCDLRRCDAKHRTRAGRVHERSSRSRRPRRLPHRGLARQCKVAGRRWHAFGLQPGNMKGAAAPASAVRRQLSLQQRAVEQLRALAKPYRLRVQVDAEGFPFIPGRYGQIEWHCDGVNCWSCALPGQLALAVHTDRPRLFEKLWVIPGVRRHQRATPRCAPCSRPTRWSRSPWSSRPGAGARCRPQRPAGGGSNPHTERPQNPRSDDRWTPRATGWVNRRTQARSLGFAPAARATE